MVRFPVLIAAGSILAGLASCTSGPAPSATTAGEATPKPCSPAVTNSATPHGEAIFAEFVLPTPSTAEVIAAASDGSAWFTEYQANQIGRVRPDGKVVEYRLAQPPRFPREIIRGPDGAIWFTEEGISSLGRISPDGTIMEFALPFGGRAIALAAGPDGNVWYTNPGRMTVGKITSGGSATEYAVSFGTKNSITAGSDGNLWYVAPFGRISPDGQTKEFAVDFFGVGGLVAGPDGNVWFLDNRATLAPKVGYITPNGQVQRYPLGGPPRFLAGLTATSGAVWYSDGARRLIGRIEPNGNVTEYPLPWPNAVPERLASGPNGELWMIETNPSETNHYRIARLCPPRS